jgi:hypothetical protein
VQAEVEYTALVSLGVDLETGAVAAVGIHPSRDEDERPSEVSVSLESETGNTDADPVRRLVPRLRRPLLALLPRHLSPYALAARRLPRLRAHRFLARIVGATTLVMTVAAAAWFGAVTAHAPSSVGAAQLTVTGTFMLAGTAPGRSAARSTRA